MRLPTLMTLWVLAACGARVDPLAQHRQDLARAARASVDGTPQADLAVRVSPVVLARVARAAVDTGPDDAGAFVIPTLLGRAHITAHPEDDGGTVTLEASSACANCVRVVGTVTGQVTARLGNGTSVRSRAGVAANVPVELLVETEGAGTDIGLVAHYQGPRDIDVQLLGLPLGGMGLNDGLRAGVREALDGNVLPVAYVPANGPVPLGGVRVEAGGIATASLRVLGATPAPAPPDLNEGVWVGLSEQTARGWIEALTVRRSTKRWSARPESVSFADDQVIVSLEVWRHRVKPRLRTYRIAARVQPVAGQWAISDIDVGRVDRSGVDPLSGAIGKRIERTVHDLIEADWLAGSGDLKVREGALSWRVRRVSMDEGQLQIWFAVD